jgi:hypothetical protein
MEALASPTAEDAVGGVPPPPVAGADSFVGGPVAGSSPGAPDPAPGAPAPAPSLAPAPGAAVGDAGLVQPTLFSYVANDLVWARAGSKGSEPFWPGRMIDVTEAPEGVRRECVPNSVCVQFYGPSASKTRDRDYCWALEHQLAPFAENLGLLERQTIPKRLRPTAFREAMAEVKALFLAHGRNVSDLHPTIVYENDRADGGEGGEDGADDRGPDPASRCSSCGVPLEKASGSRTSAGSGAGETSRRCRLCAKLHKEGQFCPVCDVVWQWANCPAMVGCDSCDFWVHATCDPKAQAVMDAEAEEGAPEAEYSCPRCVAKTEAAEAKRREKERKGEQKRLRAEAERAKKKEEKDALRRAKKERKAAEAAAEKAAAAAEGAPDGIGIGIPLIPPPPGARGVAAEMAAGMFGGGGGLGDLGRPSAGFGGGGGGGGGVRRRPSAGEEARARASEGQRQEPAPDAGSGRSGRRRRGRGFAPAVTPREGSRRDPAASEIGVADFRFGLFQKVQGGEPGRPRRDRLRGSVQDPGPGVAGPSRPRARQVRGAREAGGG